MRYALLMHYREPGEGAISEEAITRARKALGAYGRTLESAGVLLSADVLQPSAATTTVTRREGGLQVQDGPSPRRRRRWPGFSCSRYPTLTRPSAGPRSVLAPSGVCSRYARPRPPSSTARGHADVRRRQAGSRPSQGEPGPAARSAGVAARDSYGRLLALMAG